MPGCQVLVAKQGVIIYRKSFGCFTYNNNVAVNNDDLYDLASVTKTMATTLVTMSLYDQKRIDLDKQLMFYLPDVKGSNKESIPLVDLMTHQARLEPFIPFYVNITANEKVRNTYFSRFADKNKPVQVADSMFIFKTYRDSIYKRIFRSKLLAEKEYKYSDLGFYLMQAVVENLTHRRLDFLSDSIIYKRIGAITMCFNPMNKFTREKIVPTENDTVFRKQLVWGYVHDPGSALMGGVAGHAGLFSNTNDLAKICQMLLWDGNYGGIEYFSKSTVDKFTSCQFCPTNRRGLGFDKPEPDKNKESPVSKKASLKTFGHQGFTGTCYWVDPEKDLVYIFLSNRVYPDAENKKITTLGVRNKVMDVIYNAISN